MLLFYNRRGLLGNPGLLEMGVETANDELPRVGEECRRGCGKQITTGPRTGIATPRGALQQVELAAIDI